MKINNIFHRFAVKTSKIIGSPWAFVVAVSMILLWLLSGPFFHYSDYWQLIVNTTTTICTFIIAILIQHTQNRDTNAIHIKLDELIRSHRSANNQFMGLENLTDEQLKEILKKRNAVE